MNPLYKTSDVKSEIDGSDVSSMCDEYEVQYSNLHFIGLLGEGAFGQVMKAQFFRPGADKSTPIQVVAVKKLKGLLCLQLCHRIFGI